MHRSSAVVALAIPLLSSIGLAQVSRFLPPTPAIDPFLGCDTVAVLARDFDGDGRTDLFFANRNEPSQLLRNVEPWRFEQVGTVSSVAWIGPATAADFDSDGDLDLVLATDSSSGVVTRLFRNNGGGGFTDVTATSLPFSFNFFNPQSFAAGDVDGDGDTDLVVGYAQNRLFLNNGIGVFVDGTLGGLPLMAVPALCVSLVDVDGDQDLDLLGSHDPQYQRLLRLALNDGAGHFTDVSATHLPPVNPTVIPPQLTSIGAGDIDGDGDIDLVLGVDTPHVAGFPTTVYINDGTGHFTDQTVGRLPWVQTTFVALLDADGDQDLDLFAARRGVAAYAQPRLFLNNGNGVFADATATMMPAMQPSTSAIATGDLDGDGRTDVCIGCYSEENTPEPTGRNVLLQNQAGVFVERLAKHTEEPWDGMVPIASLRTNSTVLIDHDHDGDLDLVIGNDWGQQDRLYENDGHGVFTDVTALRMPVDAVDTVEIAAGDVNGDTYQDLVLAVWGGQSRLYFGSASGGFVDATAGHMPAASLLAITVALGDLDNDGDLDIVLGTDCITSPSWAATNGTCRVLRNNGLGSFVDLGPFVNGFAVSVSSLELADFDLDGDLDVFAAKNVAGVYLNNGLGSMTLGAALPGSGTIEAGTAGDFDGDGRVDLFVSRYVSPNWFYAFHRNLGNATFAPAVQFAGVPNVTRMVPFDQDGDGDLDVLCVARTSSSYPPFVFPPFVRVYQNQGGGVFAPQQLYDLGEYSRGAAVGDVDGDGDSDVLIGNHLAGPWVPPTIACVGQTRLHANVTRHVSIDSAPRLGTTQTVRAWALPPVQMQTAPRLAAIYASFGLLPSPVALPPFGNVLVDPTSIVPLSAGLVPATGGNYAANLVIPNNPSLVNLSIYFQAIVEGRTATGAPELRLTNALGETIRL